MTVKDTILLATRNQGKIRELTEMLAPFHLAVIGLEAFPQLQDVEEDGTSFAENALLKARYAAANSGLVAVADDSGLMVDALGGAPGIYSARFSLPGNPFDDGQNEPCEERNLPVTERNNRKLLRLLADLPYERRGARFCSALAAVAPMGESLNATGLWEGVIASAPKGENGFGYDPLFLDPELGLTAAEMSPQEKNRRSHRARAMRALARLWPEFWASLLKEHNHI